MKALSVIFIVSALLLPFSALAHCPLCTAGAGILAVAAASVGISTAAIGIFIGAFAVALGLWFSGIIKRQIIPFQKWLLVIASFFLTVWPLAPLLTGKYDSFYISWFGDYGSLFNRTYIINWFLWGSVIGAMLMLAAPFLSQRVSKIRSGKRFAYQDIIIVFILLIMAGAVLQLVVE